MSESCSEGSSSCSQKNRANFLVLPREARDLVYELSLVASSPIVVWSAKETCKTSADYPPYDQNNYENPIRDPRDFFVYGLKWDHEAMISSVQNLALSLFRCNRIIAPEAVSTFYGKNTFSFLGAHDWVPIISWLDRISETNRGYLTNLEASVRTLSTAWQYSDGTRARIRRYRKNEIFQRSPHFSRPLEPLPQGEVENIDPAIETIISILGRSEGAPKLTLTLKLNFDLIPGITVIDQSQDGEDSYMSMDLPNLIEKWRVDYSTDFRCRPVEVIWKAESYRKESTDKREFIKAAGWEILKEEEAEKRPRTGTPYPTMRFILRRKELIGPLVAADPSPWTWRLGPSP